MSISLDQIAKLVDGECLGDPSVMITGLAGLDKASDSQISFLFDPRYKKYLFETKAAAVLITKEHADNCPSNCIVVNNPYVAYAKISSEFDTTPVTDAIVHPSAIIHESASLGQNVSIGPNSVIHKGASIGDNTIIGSNCVIRENVKIGNDCNLQDNISIYHGCVLWNRVRIHSGAVIGADGFGIAKDKGQWHKIAQLGIVEIHDDVDVGANTTIDRGAIENTVIKKGVKLDNQIQIGHNVVIGENTAVAGCAGIAGSTIIGNDCLIGGGVGISGHNNITDNVTITAFSGVRGDLTKPGIYSAAIGSLEFGQWRKIEARLRKLNHYIESLNKLEKRVTVIEESNEN